MTDNGSGGLGVVLCHVCQKPVRFAATSWAGPVRFAATTVEHLDGSPLCIEAVPLTDNHHLPECWVKYESDPSSWCICDELRECAARVRKVERSNNFTPDDHADAMTEAYRRGLDASREAVGDQFDKGYAAAISQAVHRIESLPAAAIRGYVGITETQVTAALKELADD